MGCCCSSRRTELDRTPVYLYCSRASEEREPLSSTHGTASVISSGLLVRTDLRSSSPDTYRAPPAPLPFDMGLPLGESLSGTGFENCEDPKESDCINGHEFEKGCPKSAEEKLSKLSAYIASPVEEEEDVCPTCLEEYDTENPRIIAKCEHHFHLSCILEWMERSDTCPICDQIMVIDHSFNE